MSKILVTDDESLTTTLTDAIDFYINKPTYIRTNEFTKVMYEYKGNTKLKNEFINKYRSVDVLLIDDIQFLIVPFHMVNS